MAHLNRAVAVLRIVGEDLEPDEISALLGRQPSRSQRKGQEIQTNPGRPPRIAKFGNWRMDAQDTEPENLDQQVVEMLNGLTTDLAVWRDLSSRYKVDVFCGWFMRESNEGVDIAPETLLALGQRNIALALDIYAPDSDA